MISIVIPVLNEANTIFALTHHLQNVAKHPEILEIIVVDGGSTDGTISILKTIDGISVYNSSKGRAKQMNFGASKAKHNILYFLHADSFPPQYFDALILEEVRKGYAAGCFRMRFDSQHWWLQLTGWLTRFSWRACRGGDQSLFITKTLFQDIGGYDEEYVIYEDNIIISALYKRKHFKVIPSTLVTSARLFETHGVFKVQFHFLMIYLKRWFGASADELYGYYKKYFS